jgi:hypothetical protein
MRAGTPRRTVHVLLGRPYGHPTGRPPVRRPLVLLARRQKRRATKAQLFRPVFHLVLPVVPHAKALIVLLTKRRRQPRTIALLSRTFGHATRNPPVRPPLVLLARRRKQRVTETILRKVSRTPVVVTAFPGRIKVLLARNTQRRRAISKFTRAYGGAITPPPPVVTLQTFYFIPDIKAHVFGG